MKIQLAEKMAGRWADGGGEEEENVLVDVEDGSRKGEEAEKKAWGWERGRAEFKLL